MYVYVYMYRDGRAYNCFCVIRPLALGGNWKKIGGIDEESVSESSGLAMDHFMWTIK